MSLLFLASVFFAGCSEDVSKTEENTNPPMISNFEPQNGSIGTEVTIFGENLQKVSSVTIGNGIATVKYRISPTQMIAVITNECTTGTLTVKNNYGTYQTTDVFTVTYPVPSISSYPNTAQPNDEVLIEGENLNAVSKVYFGNTEGTIISQDKKNLVVKVPYFESASVAISLAYSDGAAEQKVSTQANFDLSTPEPVITNFPTSAEVGKTIEITGENLNTITGALFGEYQGTVLSQSATSIKVVLPADFTVTETVPFKLIYYGVKELLVSNYFEVIVPDASTIYYWENKTIYCQDETTTDNFFNAMTGEIYTPCDYEGIKSKIYFFITISATSTQLNNPANSGNQTKNFKCNGAALPTETMPLIVKFRILSDAVEAENYFIQKVKNKELTEINPQMIADAGIPNAGTSAPRYYGPAETNQYQPGNVIMFQQFDGATPVKVGFIEVLKIDSKDPKTDKTGSMTFNCYFQK